MILKRIRLRRALAPAAGALLLAVLSPLGTSPADAAVIYCTGPGVPVGCVVRPTPYVAPAARAAVYCTRPGFPAGCVAGVGAPGVGVAGTPNARAVARPGRGVNAGGGVNRPGLY